MAQVFFFFGFSATSLFIAAKKVEEENELVLMTSFTTCCSIEVLVIPLRLFSLTHTNIMSLISRGTWHCKHRYPWYRSS